MKKVIISLLMISFFLTGCSSSISRMNLESDEEYYARITKKCSDRETLIKTFSSEEFMADEITIQKDSTRIRIKDSNELKVLATKQIKQIKYSDYKHGILMGVGGGGVISLTALLLLATFSDSQSMAWPFVLIGGTVLGLLTGLVIGIFGGSDIIINVN